MPAEKRPVDCECSKLKDFPTADYCPHCGHWYIKSSEFARELHTVGACCKPEWDSVGF